jgi:hypothetical protein
MGDEAVYCTVCTRHPHVPRGEFPTLPTLRIDGKVWRWHVIALEIFDVYWELGLIYIYGIEKVGLLASCPPSYNL